MKYRGHGFLQVLDKYTNLGIYVIHHSLTLAELFALSGLHFTSQTIKSGFMAAEESVAILDGIFGSNESSRAIASIITLVHRELVRDPDFKLAQKGKTAILSGLTKAVTSFAILQNFTHTRTLNQMGIADLWKGLVVEEEKSEKSTSSHPDIIHELEDILMENQVSSCGEPFRLYEISTNTKRTIIKTTKIRPIDVHGKEQPQTKQIVQKTNEEEDEAFMAVVNSQQDQKNGEMIPGAWPEQTPDKKSGLKIMLASVSRLISRKRVERQETLGVISENIQLEPNFEDSLTKITSTSTALQSTISDSQESFSKIEPAKRHTSWILNQKKSVSNLIQMGANVISKKKKPRSESPPMPLTSISHSDNNLKNKSDSFHSSTSLSSIARTLKTTTYTSRPASLSPHSLLDTEPHPDNFPRKHIITNISHFIRYASAAYGESFMRILGIGDIPSVLPDSYHPNHHAFAHHTGVSVHEILLSSYTDSSLFSSVSHTQLHALVHYVTVDHFAEAIVLTCRGTLGLSDILTDLTCDYKEFSLPSDPQTYAAHGGMLEAAQLLALKRGKVFEAIQKGLESYSDYGLVICGHSLGAGVASLLSILWSERSPHHFITSATSGLPSGRPIHCYTYGSPCVMSLALSDYCQGLVTSVVHGFDIVSSLSLGLLKDFKNIAVSLYEEGQVADEMFSRIIYNCQKRRANETTREQEENDQWFWALIKTMRADMKAEKLFPPKNVYLIECIPQLAQHSQSKSQSSNRTKNESKHKIAYMIRFSQCQDIQARFSEIVFSKTMFMDHSPKMYEKAIKLLNKGYFG
ncbi:hypothetical protein G6F56_007872 [Rhizopus delemar]|uniref:sn-1-specific diacylglycerol lipase n=1 Tax=Rhizopus stolonifer TaxID=4846 RepID=A0A367KX19_RHIST|nr:hypothetical protein G6F56_007872 [Rhizopus delemar]RCI06759.1 hypothetical protein CU098_013805 [Rhizopus stolonifer]